MDKYDDSYLKERPQSLCKMCGKCCRVVTASYTYEEIKDKAHNGDEGAIDFLDIFEPFESIEAAKEADADTVNNIINGLKEDGKYDESKMTFYGCRYLLDNNLCGRYESRKTLCKHFPGSPWAIVPPGCGFEGWLFLKREEIKQKIRKAKEDLLELNVLRTKVTDPETIQKIDAVEKKILTNIEFYKKYGSSDW